MATVEMDAGLFMDDDGGTQPSRELRSSPRNAGVRGAARPPRREAWQQSFLDCRNEGLREAQQPNVYLEPKWLR